MKQHGMLFADRLMPPLLDGTKTQTRRLLKVQPKYWADADLEEFYSTLCGPEFYEPVVVGRDGDERPGKEVFGVYSEDGEWGCECPYLPADLIVAYNGHCETLKANQRRRVAFNPSIAEQRLHGGERRSDLLSDPGCVERREEASGVVSPSGICCSKGVSNSQSMPREREDHSQCSSVGLHGVSRCPTEVVNAGSPSGRQPREQPPREPLLGNSSGELGRPEASRNSQCGGEASSRSPDGCGIGDGRMGHPEGPVQSTARGENLGGVALRNSTGGRSGDLIWARESFWVHPCNNDFYARGCGRVKYNADLSETDRSSLRSAGWVRKPSIHMPKWACRCWLEITDVRVQRIQEISDDDLEAEGSPAHMPTCHHYPSMYPATCRHTGEPLCSCPSYSWKELFAESWATIYPGSWERNDWVWALTLKRTKVPQ